MATLIKAIARRDMSNWRRDRFWDCKNGIYSAPEAELLYVKLFKHPTKLSFSVGAEFKAYTLHLAEPVFVDPTDHTRSYEGDVGHRMYFEVVGGGYVTLEDMIKGITKEIEGLFENNHYMRKTDKFTYFRERSGVSVKFVKDAVFVTPIIFAVPCGIAKTYPVENPDWVEWPNQNTFKLKIGDQGSDVDTLLNTMFKTGICGVSSNGGKFKFFSHNNSAAFQMVLPRLQDDCSALWKVHHHPSPYVQLGIARADCTGVWYAHFA